MLQTLFHVPEKIAGVPVFGEGWLLAAWAVASVALLAWFGLRRGFSHPETLSHAALLLVVGAVIWKVLPKIVEPELGLPIRGYGVMLLAAIVAGGVLCIRRGGQLGLSADRVISLLFWVVVPGIVGSRAFYVIQYWHEFQRETLGDTLGAVINLTQGGIVVYGALIGALLGSMAYIAKEKLPALATMDLLVPGMLLGQAIGRIGCFLNGCCFGGPCDLPWAVQFPAGTPPYLHEAERGELFLQGLRIAGETDGPPVITAVEPGSPAAAAGLAPGQTVAQVNGRPVATAASANLALVSAGQSDPRVAVLISGRTVPARFAAAPPPSHSARIHPTQLYSAIDALVLCLLLLAYDPFRKRDGELLALFLTIYPVARFVMETIRTDEAKAWIAHLTIGQVTSIVMLAVAAGLWMHLLRKPPGKARFAPAA